MNLYHCEVKVVEEMKNLQLIASSLRHKRVKLYCRTRFLATLTFDHIWWKKIKTLMNDN